jgi:hypothetical protein
MMILYRGRMLQQLQRYERVRACQVAVPLPRVQLCPVGTCHVSYIRDSALDNSLPATVHIGKVP